MSGGRMPLIRPVPYDGSQPISPAVHVASISSSNASGASMSYTYDTQGRLSHRRDGAAAESPTCLIIPICFAILSISITDRTSNAPA